MRPWSKLGESARLLRAQPFLSLVHGAALVVALFAVCCGLGMLAAPWFGCELFATQIGAGTGRRPARTRGWIGAGLFLCGAVAIVSSAAWLSTLWLGPEMHTFGGPEPAGPGDLRAAALSLGGALSALLFIVPFLYAPMILVHRGGSLGGAALESARLVTTGGLFAHWTLSVVSHLVQASPVLVAGLAAALLSGRGEVPWAVLAATPLLAVSIPLGQGMIVAAFLERRDGLVEAAATRPIGRPPKSLALALGAVLLAPGLALALVVASLARPSEARPGGAPYGEVLVDVPIDPAREHVVPIPATALDVRITGRSLSVEASDGGGAGEIAGPTARAIEGLRVVRVRDAYAVEARTSDGSFVTWVSRAGVRLDDGLRARLADRLPAEALIVLALALLITPLAVGRVLAALAEVRRLGAGSDPDATVRAEAARPAAHRAGWRAAAALAPLALASLAVGVLALM